MRIIYKYPVHTVGPLEIEVPQGSRVLSAQLQNDVIVAWVEQSDDPLEFTETVVFQNLMTGHPTDDGVLNWTFLATNQLDGFVLHTYYRKLES